MTKLSTRWTQNPDCYAYHMLNKSKILNAMFGLYSGKSLEFKHLAGLIVKKDWCEPEPTDFPNYQFVYKMSKDYLAYASKLDKPVAEGIVYENLVRYLASLAKQDPAYYTRFNGILFRVLHDYTRGQISAEPGANHEYIKFLVKWWDTFDGRERNHEVYKRFLDYMVDQYFVSGFHTKSIDFCLNWVGEHQSEFVYSDDMNPKKWYGNCGVGFVDDLTMGGMGAIAAGGVVICSILSRLLAIV